MESDSLIERELIRRARLAEALTLAWMVVELVVALWAGIAARSVALTTFGVDSGIELFTAGVVLRQLLLHSERASDEELDRRERQASRLVGYGLYGLVVYILATSVWSLASGSRPESSSAGIALALAALVVMPVLWRWRLGSGRPARESRPARRRRLLAGLHLHVGGAAGRPAAEPPVRLVVGGPGRGPGHDLVDQGRGRRGARGGAHGPARGRRAKS